MSQNKITFCAEGQCVPRKCAISWTQSTLVRRSRTETCRQPASGSQNIKMRAAPARSYSSVYATRMLGFEHRSKALCGILAAVDIPEALIPQVLAQGLSLAQIHDDNLVELQVLDDFQLRRFDVINAAGAYLF